MKCPKCGYLGFETSDRCRNCGYDFSLTIPASSTPELPLQQRDGAGAPLADLDLARPETAPPLSSALDLDRLIGETPVEEPEPRPSAAAARARHDEPLPVVVTTPPDTAKRSGVHDDEGPLPLFAPESVDDEPLITAPRPVRPPLSVRRATPDLARGRTRTPRIHPRRGQAASLDLDAPHPSSGEFMDEVAVEEAVLELTPASVAARVTAMLIDGILLAAIDSAILYFTLAIAGLTLSEVSVIPPVPFAAFLLMLNGGYLILFTVAGGQTIGKMAVGIRVVSNEGARLGLGAGVARALGCLVSIATLGIGYLPVLFGGRALQDRLAATRVVGAD